MLLLGVYVRYLVHCRDIMATYGVPSTTMKPCCGYACSVLSVSFPPKVAVSLSLSLVRFLHTQLKPSPTSTPNSNTRKKNLSRIQMGVLYKTTKSYRARKEEISFCLNRIQIDHVAWGRAFLLSLPSRFACCVFVLTALAAFYGCGCIRIVVLVRMHCWRLLDSGWILDSGFGGCCFFCFGGSEPPRCCRHGTSSLILLWRLFEYSIFYHAPCSVLPLSF